MQPVRWRCFRGRLRVSSYAPHGGGGGVRRKWGGRAPTLTQISVHARLESMAEMKVNLSRRHISIVLRLDWVLGLSLVFVL